MQLHSILLSFVRNGFSRHRDNLRIEGGSDSEGPSKVDTVT